MPFGVKPICSICKTMTSTMWRKGPEREVLCNSCGLKRMNDHADGDGDEDTTGTGNKGTSQQQTDTATSSTCVKLGRSSGQLTSRVRKSTRIKPSKYKLQASTKNLSTKGKGRRAIFKKQPMRSHAAVATVVTSNSIFYDGIYWQTGDIASVMDCDDKQLYYVQMRGFLCDQYCQKSAVITWLIPIVKPVSSIFHPPNYILGPEEDVPRKMNYFEFVCHAPSEYYKAHDAPYRTLPTTHELGFIWTRIGGEIKTVPTHEEIFGLNADEPEQLTKRTVIDVKNEDISSETVKKEKLDAKIKAKE